MFALPFMRRRSGGGAAASIPPGTYATPQDLATAISQLIGGSPPLTLDTIAEVAAYAMNNADTVAAISAAIANKQDKHARLTALSALALAADKLIYATGENTLAATALTAFMRTVLAAQDAAGARAAIGALANSDAGAFGKSTLALDKPPAFAVPMSSDAVGGANTLQTGDLGRVVMAMTKLANQGGYYQFPALSDSGSPTARYVSIAGLQLLTAVPPSAGAIPYFARTDIYSVDFMTSGAFGRTWLAAASAKSARTALSRKAATAYTTGSVALAANSTYDVYFSGTEASLGYDLPNAIVADSGVSAGRITASGIAGETAIFSVSGAVVVDAQCELVIEWVLTSIYESPYVPAVGSGLSRPEASQVPGFTVVKIPKPGRAVFQGPRNVPISGLGNRQQLRVKVTSLTAVNMTSLGIRLEQEATEVTS